MAAMNRSEIIDDLAAKFGHLTKGDTDLAVSTIFDAMNSALVAGNRIEIRGFGSFSVTRRAARIGRNPRNGESVAIPETRVVHFKSGKALRDAVDTD
jgi:integration host factor subunit beta